MSPDTIFIIECRAYSGKWRVVDTADTGGDPTMFTTRERAESSAKEYELASGLPMRVVRFSRQREPAPENTRCKACDGHGLQMVVCAECNSTGVAP